MRNWVHWILELAVAILRPLGAYRTHFLRNFGAQSRSEFASEIRPRKINFVTFCSLKAIKKCIDFLRQFRKRCVEPPESPDGQKAKFCLVKPMFLKTGLCAPGCFQSRFWNQKWSQNRNRGRILETKKGARMPKMVVVCRRGWAGGGVRGGKPPQIRFKTDLKI